MNKSSQVVQYRHYDYENHHDNQQQILVGEDDQNHNDDDTNIAIQKGEEVGFFFLNKTVISLIVPEKCHNNQSSSSFIENSSILPYSKHWVNVTTAFPGEEQKQRQKQEEETCCRESSKEPNAFLSTAATAAVCPRCNLVLYYTGDDDQEDGTIVMKPLMECYFDGTLSDMEGCPHDTCSSSSSVGCITTNNANTTHNTTTNTNTEKVHSTKRSDAVLWMGTILKCQSLGYLHIESFKVSFLGFVEPMDGVTTTSDEEEEKDKIQPKLSLDGKHPIKTETRLVYASMVVTISLPHLERLSNTATSFLHQRPHYDEEFLSTNSHGFPPCGQLLFSLLRSDWDWLDATMAYACEENRKALASLEQQFSSMIQYADEQSIFPKDLTLEELYLRLSNSATSTTEKSCKNITCRLAERKDLVVAGDLSLPEELLVYKLAPYLRAKSLHNLRSTCRYLNHVLKAVVPGLRLQLYPHQVTSLSWMRKREHRSMTEYDAMKLGPNYSLGGVDEFEVLHGDVFRSVTSGGMVSVVPRGRKGKGYFWLVNAWSGACWMNINGRHRDSIKAVAQSRRVARGGLLCDDPGLGKTITVLSLVLQTLGQSTEKISGNGAVIKIRDQDIIDAYWREMLVSRTRQDELLALTLKLRKCDLEQYFQYPVIDILSDTERDVYERLIKNPICMEDVIRNIRNNSYDESFEKFSNDIHRIYQNAILYNSPDSLVHQKAQLLKEKVHEFFHEFREKQLISAIGAAKRSNSTLGSLIQQKKQSELLDTLLPSRGTLLVVPHTLVEHWVDQINLHINFSAISRKPALIYKHRRGRNNPTWCSSHVETSDYRIFHELCFIKKSHFPFLFVDESTENLPSEELLASFLIVLTTTKRLTTEWKNGSFEEELRREKHKNIHSFRGFSYDIFNEYNNPSPCPLLKVHWLRLIVDEGHTMGKRGQPTNAIDFASWIFAERRWAMTGTPTPQSIDKDGLGNLFGLFKFLKHQYFVAENWGEERCKILMKDIKAGQLAVFFKLRHLLNLFMIRHTKLDVVQLHKPILKVTRMQMSIPEILAYNTLVTAVQMNLVATSMEGKTSGKQDSLLNARQTKHARQALSNIRLACCGGTQIVPTLTEENWLATIKLMRCDHGSDDITITLVENFLSRMTNEQLSSCMACGIQLQTLFLLPCGCQICTECVTPTTKKCLVCNRDFDVDKFQKLQPGLEYKWKWNIETQKNDVQTSFFSQSLEHIQHYHHALDQNQDIHMDGIRNDVEEPIADPVAPQRGIRRRRNDDHACRFTPIYRNGKCLICFQPHQCVLHEILECKICHNKAEECPQKESKAFYIINKLQYLWYQYKNRGNTPSGDPKRPLKVLIFSQFRQISDVVGDRLIRRFGLGCVAEYWGQGRNSELMKFTHSNDCFCMLLAKEGSHGLNLSFVTHIFFLDEILDKSLECQVVARAYRMGATENVYVEQLVAKHSIEELIVKMNKRDGLHNQMYSKNSYQENEFTSEYYELQETVAATTTTTSATNNSGNRNRVGFLLSNVKIIKPHSIGSSCAKRKIEKQKDHKKKRRVQFAM